MDGKMGAFNKTFGKTFGYDRKQLAQELDIRLSAGAPREAQW
ncbi:hypothetical protein [Streptomyces sp. NPDC050263]